LDTFDNLCYVCTLVGCVNCSDINTCVECNITDNYVLPIAATTCMHCSMGVSYANASTGLCESCQLSNCLVCLTLTVCQTCDTFNGY
jgi:hypothetical protein